MRRRKSRIVALLITALMATLLVACGEDVKKADRTVGVSDLAVEEYTDFGSVYLKITPKEFNKLGFELGDSVDVSFSNGFEMKDIPYYSGYYGEPGTHQLVAYPGYPYVTAVTLSGGLWKEAKLSNDDTVTITLNEQGKYADIQKARDLHYTDERSDYADDATFANFRAVKVGKLKANTLYRSASPIDNQHKRASVSDKLMGEAGVKLVLDMADGADDVDEYIGAADFQSPNFKKLYDAGKVDPMEMSVVYRSKENQAAMKKGLTRMATEEGPYLIHCTEGKDRTGFLSMLLEMLAGANYDELEADYMKSYYNYYGITKESDHDKYDLIVESVFHPLLKEVTGADVSQNKNSLFVSAAEKYLQNMGMSKGEISKLKEHLCGK